MGCTDTTILESFDLDIINELNILSQIYNHSSKGVKGFGSENNKELFKVSSLGSENQLELLSKKREIEIKSFYDKGEISVRAYNICMENHLNTLGELIEYKEKYSDFYRLSKCGRKTNDELTILANKEVEIHSYQNNIEDEVGCKVTSWNNLSELVSSLVKKDRDSINDFINFVLSSLSSRSQKYITEYYNQDLRVKKIVSEIRLIDNNSNIKVGSKSFKDINFFYDQVLKNIYLDRNERKGLIEQLFEVLLYDSRDDFSLDI